jgi:hypothetical protein
MVYQIFSQQLNRLPFRLMKLGIIIMNVAHIKAVLGERLRVDYR